jgi:ATP-dependent protease ClpP protease subunit
MSTVNEMLLNVVPSFLSGRGSASLLALAMCHGLAMAQTAVTAAVQAGPAAEAPAASSVPVGTSPFEAGLQAYERDAFAEAISHWQQAARGGSGVAALNLGVLYESGQGVASDRAAAARWYGMAAMAGIPEAQLALGKLHEMGRGVPKNLEEARFWYGLAASSAADGPDGEALRRQADDRLKSLPTPELERIEFDGGRFVFREAVGATCLIGLQGRVTLDTSRTFAQVVERARSTGCSDPIILLESPGGNLGEGTELGVLVRRFKWTTAVRGSCASSCALIFLGGVKRQLFGPNARIGLHQASRKNPLSAHPTCFTSPQDDANRAKLLYLKLMVPQQAEGIFERSMKTTCRSIDWMEGVEALKMGVATALR